MIATERLYLTSDRSRVVSENDPAAAFLLAPKGAEIPKKYLTLVKQESAAQQVEESPVQVANKETTLPRIRRR